MNQVNPPYYGGMKTPLLEDVRMHTVIRAPVIPTTVITRIVVDVVAMLGWILLLVAAGAGVPLGRHATVIGEILLLANATEEALHGISDKVNADVTGFVDLRGGLQ